MEVESLGMHHNMQYTLELFNMFVVEGCEGELVPPGARFGNRCLKLWSSPVCSPSLNRYAHPDSVLIE